MTNLVTKSSAEFVNVSVWLSGSGAVSMQPKGIDRLRAIDLSFHPDRRMASPAVQPGALLERMAAFADATRLRLLRLLEKSELGVAELMELLQLPQSTVSRHLKVLFDQGLVKSRAEGANRLYRMPPIDDAAARRLWQLAKEQTEGWATAR